MSNYEIKIQIEVKATENKITQGAVPSSDGSFKIVIPKELGLNIDQCEQALLTVNYPAIREALSRHLSEVSKQEAEGSGMGVVKKTATPISLMEKSGVLALKPTVVSI